MAQRDKISEALTTGMAATIGATILAIPWYGFWPLAVVLSGLAVTAGWFKAATSKPGP